MKKLLSFLILLMTCTAINAADRLNVFVWSNAIPIHIIQQFESETGISVNFSTYDSTEAMATKLRASRLGLYDVIEPSSYFVPRLIRARLLEPLDKSQLPNLKHIDPALLDHAYDPGNQYTIPYILGITGIFLHKERYSESSASWRILWEERFKNQLLLVDDALEIFSVALLSLGYKTDSTDPEELRLAYLHLKRLLPNIRVFGSDVIASILADEDAYAGVVWNGDVVKAKRENPHLQFIYPQEGPIIFVDGLAIPANAPNKANAYRFINFLMRPEIAKEMVLTFGYTTANKSAHALLPAAIRDNPSYYPPEDVIARGHFQGDLTDEAIALISRYWTLLKLDI